MYAQAEDNFWQLEEDYIHAVGRSAELYGERDLLSGLLYRAFEVERKSKQEYQQAGPAQRALCDAFAAGVNYYIEKHPEVKPRLLTSFEPWFIFALQRNVSWGVAAAAGANIDDLRAAMPEVDRRAEAPHVAPRVDAHERHADRVAAE